MTTAALGLITPPTNTVNAREWHALLAPGAELQVATMALHLDTGSPRGRAALERDLAAAGAALLERGATVVAYGCTAGSMTVPSDALPRWMAATLGVPCVATADAIVQALRALGARRLSVATPYGDTLNRHERRFLEASGFEVLSLRGLGFGEGGPHEFSGIAHIPPDAVRSHLLASVHPDADALLVSCTDFPSLGLVAEMEQLTARPVVTSNTATLWHAVRAGAPVALAHRPGRLLAGLP